MIPAADYSTDKREREKMSVLAIDDDPTQRLLIGAALEGDVEIIEAENGLIASQALEQRHFDIAICDLHMPVMDGFGLIEQVRTRPETRHMPIIVVTGRDDVVAIERAFALGATSFLCKPINWGIFRHQVRYVLKVSQTERALRAERDAAERLARFRQDGLAALSGEIEHLVDAMHGLAKGGAASSEPAALVEIGAAAARLTAVRRRVERASDLLTGAVSFIPQRHNAMELVRVSLDRLGGAAAANVEVSGGEDLHIACDHDLAIEALAEILKNAIRFSPPGRKAHVRIVAAPPHRVRFEIVDFGPGMPEQAADLDATSGCRRGLGLTIAKAIIDRHGGHLGIISEPEGGTDVFLSLPSA
jgi:CheY-like chemotaxis protein